VSVLTAQKCRHCPAVLRAGEEEARVRGWRIWRGTTIGGEEREDVVCAGCAGNASPEDEQEGPGWRVYCRTCHWEYDEDEDETLTPKEAKQVAYDHHCDPEVEIAPPAGDKWYDPFHVNDDGTLRESGTAA